MEILATIALAFLIGSVALLINGWFVMVLWNWVVPTVTHLPQLVYWQAFVLAMLGSCLSGPGGSCNCKKD